MSRRKPIALTLLATLLLSAGCLERKETITVKPDGAVDFEATFKGDRSEFNGPDALPTKDTGWQVTDEQSVDQNGSPQTYRIATLTVAPGKPLPETFGVKREDVNTSLRFPTTLIRETRSDGVYFHFKRTYQRRDDARFTTARRCLEMDSRMRELLEDPSSANTPDEREKIVDNLRTIELDKQLAIVDAAIATLKNRPQDVGLRIRGAVVDASSRFSLAPTIALLSTEKSDARDKAIQVEADKYIRSLVDALDLALAKAQLTAEENGVFRDTLAAEQQRRRVTESLAAHLFEVRLQLPGEIIASNADRTEDNQIVWEFQAPAIFDTDKVLMATSRVANPK